MTMTMMMNRCLWEQEAKPTNTADAKESNAVENNSKEKSNSNAIRKGWSENTTHGMMN